ncbi:MAG: twin-arginine translocation signal domain-containing protein, partial [Acidobacteriia bacterium]|nr:twin-arginine translocation signal domain-containing protein [Terriglobia bacterium]
MATKSKRSVGRRGFLKGAAAGAAVLVSEPQLTKAQEAPQTAAGSAPTTPAQRLARENGNARPPANVSVIERPGSDFMVDVLKTLDIEYLAANPGSTFESLHESLINYGPKPNSMPEFLTACHEESAVAMCHGY